MTPRPEQIDRHRKNIAARELARQTVHQADQILRMDLTGSMFGVDPRMEREVANVRAFLADLNRSLGGVGFKLARRGDVLAVVPERNSDHHLSGDRFRHVVDRHRSFREKEAAARSREIDRSQARYDLPTTF